MRCAKHLENPVQAFLNDHVTHAHDLGVVGGHPNGQITLLHLQYEVDTVFTLDGTSLNCLDLGSAMVRIYNGLADLKRHRGNPFRYLQG